MHWKNPATVTWVIQKLWSACHKKSFKPTITFVRFVSKYAPWVWKKPLHFVILIGVGFKQKSRATEGMTWNVQIWFMSWLKIVKASCFFWCSSNFEVPNTWLTAKMLRLVVNLYGEEIFYLDNVAKKLMLGLALVRLLSLNTLTPLI